MSFFAEWIQLGESRENIPNFKGFESFFCSSKRYILIFRERLKCQNIQQMERLSTHQYTVGTFDIWEEGFLSQWDILTN